VRQKRQLTSFRLVCILIHDKSKHRHDIPECATFPWLQTEPDDVKWHIHVEVRMVFQGDNDIDHFFETVADAELHDLAGGLHPRVWIFSVAGEDELAVDLATSTPRR
jgi:hypothetical protein